MKNDRWSLLRKLSGSIAEDSRATMVLVVVTNLYLFFVIAVWLLLWIGADRWWLPTIMAYGPRWVYLLPLMILVPIVVLRRRWLLLVHLAISGLIAVVPIMGLCVPLVFSEADESTLRILSANLTGKRVDVDKLNCLIVTNEPDVVLFQEYVGDTSKLVPEGWNSVNVGSLFVASRYPIRDQKSETSKHPPSKWPHTNALNVSIETPVGPVDFCSVHLRTARWGILPLLDRHTVVDPSRKYILKREINDRYLEAQELSQWLEQFSDPLIIAGDFNMPPDSVIYKRFFGRYTNAFSKAGFGFGRTRWTTMRGVTFGIRIDHVLTNEYWFPESCWVGPEINSDHLPVFTDLRLRKR
ncbi:MAG: endonuclease/exonuclease/phosphatase family protein [Pirellulales bacterium]|nr:endonuclease/exonuclease/phosphatase family protein [Pirellulales bacterium]